MRVKIQVPNEGIAPTHWTYQSFKADDSLAQGDVIARTDALLEILSKVHEHFCDPKYRGFIILSQTCDLAHGKARHVSLGIIRSLSDLFESSLREAFGFLDHGIYDIHRRETSRQLLERIVNQNEQSQGLFYLHADPIAGIDVPSVAMLRISISLRREHCPVLIGSRAGRLEEAFQARLGWLAGNLYSRVGVPDWKEQESKERERELCNEIMSFSTCRDEPIFVTETTLNKVRSENGDLDGIPIETLRDLIIEKGRGDPKDQAIGRIVQIVAKALGTNNPDVRNQIAGRLRNDAELDAHLRKWSQPREPL